MDKPNATTKSDSGSDSDTGESEDGEELASLTDFLLGFYKGLTPQVFNKDGLVAPESRCIGKVDAAKFFERLTHQLESVDEYVNFKKFFVTALNQDRDRIMKFI